MTHSKNAADLTQTEVYALYNTYGGYLGEKARSQVNHFLAAMSYPEQRVGDTRAEAGDRLYYPVLRAVAALQQKAASGALTKPPPKPRPRRPRGKTVQEIVGVRAMTRKEWAKLTDKVKQPAEAKE